MASYSSKQLLNQEEEKLFRFLSRIYRNIKRDINIELSAGRVTWADIQFLYRGRVNDAIRSAVTNMYQISARKTVERDIRVPYFLTQQDMTEIRRLTQKYQDWLWIGLEREIVKKTMTAFDPRTLMRLDPATLKLKDTFIGRMTESLHAEVAAEAVISKARQIIINIGGKSNSQFAYYANQRSASLYRSAQTWRRRVKPKRKGEEEDEFTDEPHFVWVTSESDAVCPICLPLHGRVFFIDDVNIPVPVVDTHPRCNCTLELEDAVTEEPEEEGLGEVEEEEALLRLRTEE